MKTVINEITTYDYELIPHRIKVTSKQLCKDALLFAHKGSGYLPHKVDKWVISCRGNGEWVATGLKKKHVKPLLESLEPLVAKGVTAQGKKRRRIGKLVKKEIRRVCGNDKTRLD